MTDDILEWVESMAPRSIAAEVWELLAGGDSADEHGAEADYAVTKWLPRHLEEFGPSVYVFAYMIPRLVP